MSNRWGFSLQLFISYITIFLIWMCFPNRWVYLLVGALALALLVQRFLQARRVGYFVNRVDTRLHGLVLADVFLETISFEVFRLFQPAAVAETFHYNTNFIGCTAAFTLLIGGYRYFAMHRDRQPVTTVVTATPPIQ